MAFADAHLHLATEPAGLGETLARAGVTRAFLNATGSADWAAVLAEAKNPVITAFLGVHPWYCHKHEPSALTELDKLLTKFPQAQVGEIGLDRVIDTPLPLQERFFTAQLRLAAKHGRVVCVHCVKAWDRITGLIKKEGAPPRGFILHGFNGPENLMPELAALGAYFSFGPRILNPREHKQAALAKAAPKNRVLCETDFPYGKINGIAPTGMPIAEVTAAVAEAAGLEPRKLYDNAMKIIGAL